jgi:hypothetical protein
MLGREELAAPVEGTTAIKVMTVEEEKAIDKPDEAHIEPLAANKPICKHKNF